MNMLNSDEAREFKDPAWSWIMEM